MEWLFTHQKVSSMYKVLDTFDFIWYNKINTNGGEKLLWQENINIMVRMFI